MIAIKKSRLGRQGDLLVVERDENFAYSVSDYTPTERREDDGKGAPEPHTMALRIVKDRVREACEEGATLKDRMTAKEVWERLVEEMNGQLRLPPSSKTVKRWLDRWVEDGVLSQGKPLPVEGQRKPAPSYTLPPSCTRALRMEKRLVSVLPRERLQENGSLKEHAECREEVVSSSEDVTNSPLVGEQTTQRMNGHAPDEVKMSVQEIPVPEGDLVDERPKGTSKHTKEESEAQPPARRELRYYQGPEDDFSALFEE
jgi:hypothetical protein